MGFFTLAFVALLCLAGGAAAAWFVLNRGLFGGPGQTTRQTASPRALVADWIRFHDSVDGLAAAVHAVLREEANLELIGIYAGTDDDESLAAIWRADGDVRADLPLEAPATILLQLGEAKLIDPEELAKGLRPGLPAAAPEVEASELEAERLTEVSTPPADPLYENPFELDDESLTDAAVSHRVPEPELTIPPVDEAAVAARFAALAWRGPFSRAGLFVARPIGGDPHAALDRAVVVADVAGERLGALCAAVDALRRDRPLTVNETRTPVEKPQPVAVAPTPSLDLRAAPSAGLAHAERRLAEALQSPRRESDLLRAAVSLIAEGLSADRCYAIEVEGLHTLPVEHERRSDDVSSALGLDFGQPFIQALRSRVGTTIKAVIPDARQLADMFPDVVRSSLGPADRVMIPVIEKGRIVVVFVAERVLSREPWSAEEIAFGERVAARAAVARERLRQFDALAEQAAHARKEQEQFAEALEQLQVLVSAMPDALIGLDSDGRVTFANRATAAILKRPEFDLIGKWLTEIGRDFGSDVTVWERALVADNFERYHVAHIPDAEKLTHYDMTVVPGLQANICSRLITLTERAPGAHTNGSGHDATREMAELLARLLGHMELLAGGGDLSNVQAEALDHAHRLGAELRSRLDEMMRK